jgi:SAM-dependent methyltransferase
MTNHPHPGQALDLLSLLDRTRRRLLADASAVPETLQQLNAGLNAARGTSGWAASIAACRAHPLRSLLHEDPFTRRAYDRPRGYPGDAELLDLIYERDPDMDGAPSPLGRRIFAETIACDQAEAVRGRKELMAQILDRTCDERAGARILSIACGHLREAQASRAVRAGAFSRFVGVDHDSLTLDLVRRTLGPVGVEAVQGTVASLLRRGFPDAFDLVYSAGLYDYLPTPVAQRLSARLFSLLRPGGKLLVANCAPGQVAGYMEAFMDWMLIYRDEAELSALGARIRSEELAGCRTFGDRTGCHVYLEVVRR